MKAISTIPTQPTAEVRYASLDRLPQATGSQIQRQIATLKARLIARYKLEAIPGRPEELLWRIPTANVGKLRPTRRISIGYGCGTIRIRKHESPNGREDNQRVWGEVLDLQPDDGWHRRVFEFLDGFLSDPNYTLDENDQMSFGPKPPVGPDATWPSVRPRPIKDNPQA